jgi:hypothetical protein
MAAEQISDRLRILSNAVKLLVNARHPGADSAAVIEAIGLLSALCEELSELKDRVEAQEAPAVPKKPARKKRDGKK